MLLESLDLGHRTYSVVTSTWTQSVLHEVHSCALHELSLAGFEVPAEHPPAVCTRKPSFVCSHMTSMVMSRVIDESMSLHTSLTSGLTAHSFGGFDIRWTLRRAGARLNSISAIAMIAGPLGSQRGYQATVETLQGHLMRAYERDWRGSERARCALLKVRVNEWLLEPALAANS